MEFCKFVHHAFPHIIDNKEKPNRYDTMNKKTTNLKKAMYCGSVGLAAVGAMTGCTSKKAAPSKRMNIVYIMCDDHSFQTISAYGHPLSRLAPTPNIDRLAAQGILFGRAYVENSLSTPIRA